MKCLHTHVCSIFESDSSVPAVTAVGCRRLFLSHRFTIISSNTNVRMHRKLVYFYKISCVDAIAVRTSIAVRTCEAAHGGICTSYWSIRHAIYANEWTGHVEHTSCFFRVVHSFSSAIAADYFVWKVSWNFCLLHLIILSDTFWHSREGSRDRASAHSYCSPSSVEACSWYQFCSLATLRCLEKNYVHKNVNGWNISMVQCIHVSAILRVYFSVKNWTARSQPHTELLRHGRQGSFFMYGLKMWCWLRNQNKRKAKWAVILSVIIWRLPTTERVS